MSEEILSQNQVEDLIRAMENENSPKREATPPATRRRSDSPVTPPNDPRVRTMNYDFKRPERVGKELMGALRSIHEGMGRTFNARLSSLLRTITEVKLVSADQLTYSEFVYSLDTPTCFCALNVEPLEGSWILDVAPELSFTVIDGMLGGDPQPGEHPKRALTEIEQRLITRVISLFLDCMKSAWKNIFDMKTTLRTIESNPQLLQVVPANEVIVLICYEITLNKNRGMINLCIPYNTIESYVVQLTSKGWGGYSAVPPTDETKQVLETRLDNALVELSVTLARSKIKTRDLINLEVGDVITTEHEVDKPIEVAIQRVPKFKATAGAVRGKKAIRIFDHFDRPAHPRPTPTGTTETATPASPPSPPNDPDSATNQ